MLHLVFASRSRCRAQDILLSVARLTSVAKRRKGDAGAAEAKRPAVVAVVPAQKDGTAPHTPAAVSPSRGSRAQPQEKTAPAAELTPEAPVSESLAGDPRSPERLGLSVVAALPVLVLVAPPIPSTTSSGRGASSMPRALEEARSHWTSSGMSFNVWTGVGQRGT